MNKSIFEIRQIFLDFFCSKGHQILPSSSLIPDKDPTLLFTNAGMNQFKDMFLFPNEKYYHRIATSQRCMRAGGKHNDLNKVGYTAHHHTFFEMLGNFSFGDYFKSEAIHFAWELLTNKKWFNLPKEKLWVTVHVTDNETYKIWINEVDINNEHVIRIGDNKGILYNSDNFWQMGEIGPCGPCSEIFYDYGEHVYGDLPGSIEKKGDRYIEIWNLVFMQFDRQHDGTLLPLPKLSVDTGMGLERITAVMQNVSSTYDIDLFKKLIINIAKIIGTKDLNNKSLKVIADHIRSCTFLINDGILPSNEKQGYVLRRIIRRAIRHINMIKSIETYFYKLVAPFIEVMNEIDINNQQLQSQQAKIEEVLRIEEEQFERTLQRGLSVLEKELTKTSINIIDGDTAFRLYDTYGFPLDLIVNICQERNIYFDESGFKFALEEQRKRGRRSNNFIPNYNNNNILYINKNTNFVGYKTLEQEGQVIALFRDGCSVNIIHQNEEGIVILNQTPFYGESGGQVGDQGKLKSNFAVFEVTDTQKYGKVFGHIGKLVFGQLKINDYIIAQVDCARRKNICLNHSATHLLHSALRQVLGNHVLQRGSFVNDKRLTFDFSHNQAMRSEQIRLVENIVNKQIRYNLPVQEEIMSFEEACNKGAIAIFNKKYEKQVRVLSISDFSTELCGGTHVSRTGDIGIFYIISEFSVAAGIRRIEAITGEKALILIQKQNDLIYNITSLLKISDSQTLINKIQELQSCSIQLKKEIQIIKKQQVIQKITLDKNNIKNINGIKILVSKFQNIDSKILLAVINDLKSQLDSAVIILIKIINDRIELIVGVTKNVINRIKAVEIIDHLIQQIGGRGGGSDDLARGSGRGNVTFLPVVLLNLDKFLFARLKTK